MAYSENNINLHMANGYQTPKEADVYFNPLMSFNRELVLATLRVFSDESDKVIECFDAFSATGICAMQWKKNLSDKVAVYASDIRIECINRIKENCISNNLKVEELSVVDINYGQKCLGKIEGVSVIKACADIIMRMQGFDFIHLDPYGSTAPHLESALKNIRKDGILVLTSTDVASLLSRNPETVLRNYGSKVIKTQYKKELALRTIISTAAEIAARCNKGVKVLMTVVDLNFAFVALKIERGCKNADKCLINVSELLHCRICEDRAWYKSGQLAPIVDPYTSLLTCQCHVTNSGKTGVKIGPFWSGDIVDREFVNRIISDQHFNNHSDKFKSTLTSIKSELDSFGSDEKVPSFYFFPNYLNILSQVPKLDDVIERFHERGFKASRTYIESNAVRTNARMRQVREVMDSLNNIS